MLVSIFSQLLIHVHLGDSESLSEDGIVERMVRKLPSSTVAIDKSTAASQGMHNCYQWLLLYNVEYFTMLLI